MTHKVHRFTGNECVASETPSPPQATVLDFWQWAFSDLRANDVRGVFAEWLVAKLLDIDLSTCVRDSWGGCDLATSEGIRIEVKTSAYLQAWQQKRPSQISFGRLKGRRWDPMKGYAPEATLNADFYVFCIQTEQDAARWDALDLEQWRFVLLTREQVGELGGKSVSLPRLLRASTGLLTAAQFRSAAKDTLAAVASRMQRPDRSGE